MNGSLRVKIQIRPCYIPRTHKRKVIKDKMHIHAHTYMHKSKNQEQRTKHETTVVNIISNKRTNKLELKKV